MSRRCKCAIFELSVWLFLFFMLLMLPGCHAIKDNLSYYDACKGDASCVQKMVDVEHSVRTGVSTVAGAFTPIPSMADFIGGLAAAVVAFFVGVSRGKKIILAKGENNG